MSRFKKEVKAIIKDFDVRDPRGALLAIERLCDAKISGPKKPVKPQPRLQGEVLRINVFKGDDGVFVAKVTTEQFTGEEQPVLDLAFALNAAEKGIKAIAQHTINKLTECTKEQANV